MVPEPVPRSFPRRRPPIGLSPVIARLGTSAWTIPGAPEGPLCAMPSHRDTLQLLTLELERRSRRPEGRRALRRFEARGLPTAGATTMVELVGSCHGRHGAQRDLVGGLLRLAPSDEDAALCALVAIRPALYRIARRVTAPRIADDEAVAEVVSIAWCAIREAGGSRLATPERLVRWTWTRARTSMRRRANGSARDVELPERWDAVAATDPASGSLEPLLVRAVRLGTIASGDAKLIEVTRIGGVTLEELARRRGVTRATLLKRRSRAERALRAALRCDPRLR